MDIGQGVVASRANPDLSVNGEQYARVKALFVASIALPEGKRVDFLRDACAGDAEVFTEVHSLLEHHSADPLLVEGGAGLGTGLVFSRALESGEDPVGVLRQTIDGRYRVEQLVDEGGFGFVYRATHLLWNRPVAIKFFRPFGHPEDYRILEKAFLQESALLSELSTQTTSIVQSYDVGTWTGKSGNPVLFTVLEWLEGETLASLVMAEQARTGAWGWPLPRLLRTLSPIAEALAVAHHNNVAHRDIKPSNIFLCKDAAGRPSIAKLLDFGIAKVAAEHGEGFASTGAGPTIFTLNYAAPEQLAPSLGPTGPWTDVYAFAILSVELLLGRHPTTARQMAAVVAQTTDPLRRPTPRNHGVSVSNEVEQVFARALAVKPSDRHGSAGEFWREMIDAHQHNISGTRFFRDGRSETFGGEEVSVVTPNGRDDKRENEHKATPGKWRFSSLRWLSIGAAVATGLAVAQAPRFFDGAGDGRGIDPERLVSFGMLPTVALSPGNPISDAKVQLGRRLFWDPIMSQDQDVACVSCHNLETFGVDGRRVSQGHAGQRGRRNALSVYNCAQAFAFMWDGAVAGLEEQVLRPLFSVHEMAMSEEELVGRLRRSETYRAAFAAAFGGQGNPITVRNIGLAVGAFERLLFTPSRWDTFLDGDVDALSEEEKRGFNRFVEVGCVTCHYGPYVGLTMFQKLGLVEAWPDTRDRGRYELTHQDADWMVFRVPSLRNVAETKPYFHDGSVSSLEQAVVLMGKHQLGRQLGEDEVRGIVAWLKSLSGTIPRRLSEPPQGMAF